MLKDLHFYLPATMQSNKIFSYVFLLCCLCKYSSGVYLRLTRPTHCGIRYSGFIRKHKVESLLRGLLWENFRTGVSNGRKQGKLPSGSQTIETRLHLTIVTESRRF